MVCALTEGSKVTESVPPKEEERSVAAATEEERSVAAAALLVASRVRSMMGVGK